MPHHSPTPRYIALTLAVVILVAGIWAGWRARDETGANASERKRLDRAPREAVRRARAAGPRRTGRPRYAARREEILSALEHIYGALDSDDDVVPGPGATAGVAA